MEKVSAGHKELEKLSNCAKLPQKMRPAGRVFETPVLEIVYIRYVVTFTDDPNYVFAVKTIYKKNKLQA